MKQNNYKDFLKKQVANGVSVEESLDEIAKAANEIKEAEADKANLDTYLNCAATNLNKALKILGSEEDDFFDTEILKNVCKALSNLDTIKVDDSLFFLRDIIRNLLW